jgi:hypothetical protein
MFAAPGGASIPFGKSRGAAAEVDDGPEPLLIQVFEGQDIAGTVNLQLDASMVSDRPSQLSF